MWHKRWKVIIEAYVARRKALARGIEARRRRIRHKLSSLWEDTKVFLGRTHYNVIEPKDDIIVTVGVVEGPEDRRKVIGFQGQQVAQRVFAEGDKRITETLYWIGYGPTGYKRFLIHTRTLHRTKGLRTELGLREVREADLAFAPLGRLRPRSAS